MGKADDKLTAPQIISRLSYDLIKKQPFFGDVMIRLKEAVPTKTCERAAASVTRIFYNREYIESLPRAQANFVLMHELCHIIWQHVPRRKDRNPVLWNIASDMVVNDFLKSEAESFHSMGIHIDAPDDVIFGDSYKLSGKTTEQVYDELLAENPDMEESQPLIISVFTSDDDGTSSDSGSGSGTAPKNSDGGQSGTGNQLQEDDTVNGSDSGSENDSSENGTGPDKSVWAWSPYHYSGSVTLPEQDLAETPEESQDITAAQNEIKRILTEVTMTHTFSPSGSGGLVKELDMLMGTTIPWYRYVRRYLMASENDDESYDTPNRNYLWRGDILPGPVPDEPNTLADVIVAVDTSGSVFYDHKLLTEFFYQIKRLMKDFDLTGRVISWDGCVGEDKPLDSKSDFNNMLSAVQGGGGTDLRPTLEYIQKTYHAYTCVIVLTDGWFDDPKFRIRDTLLVIPRDQNPEWSHVGKVVDFVMN